MDSSKIQGMKMNLDMAMKSAVDRLQRLEAKSPGQAKSIEREMVMAIAELTIVVATIGHILVPEASIIRPN